MIQSLPHEQLHGRELPRGTLGVAVQSASAPGLMLPHVPPIDNYVSTLGAAVGTIVAWPIRELAKGQRIVSSGGKGSVPVAPRATSIASGAMPKPSVSKTLATESTGVKKRSADQASEVVESKRVTRAQKEEDPSWEPPKKKGRIPLKKEGATKKEVTKAKVVQKPKKANAEGTTQSEVPAPSKDKVPIAKYSSEEDDEREDAGDEDRGLFTITEKSTLKWDLLDNTLHRLQDTRKVPLPPVPLCRLLPHPAVWPVQDRVHNLALEFSRNGYVPHRARFMLSIRTLDLDSVEVSHAIRKTWDPIWMQLNEEFEKQLHKSGWGDVKGKLLYTWDGNHRLRAWNAQIDTVHKEEPKYHCCVEACMVKVTKENEGEVLTVVARLNRYAMYGWLQRELDAEMNKRGGLRRRWYKVPLIVLSQLLYLEKYTKALQSVSNKRNELSMEEFTTHYRNAFYMADKKARKNTQRASAIADPNLGEEWWRLLMDIDWSKRPKWLTDDRIYSLACADLPVNHRSNVLRALVSDDPTTLYPSLKSALNDHSVFRTWLRRETWWNRLVNEATRQYALLKKSCRLLENDTLVTTIREWQSRYSGTLYEVECERLKGGLKSNKQKQKEGTNMAAKRAFYRWVRIMDWTNKVPVTKEWLNVKHTACMYTEEQRAALWPKKVYVQCPLFIDFANDTFPPNEREQFKEAETGRVKRQQEEGKNLRSLKGKDVVTEGTDNEEEVEEDREPRRSDGECPSEFEDDEDESDVPPSPTAKPTRAPQTTQGSNAKKGKGQAMDRDTPMPLNKVGTSSPKARQERDTQSMGENLLTPRSLKNQAHSHILEPEQAPPASHSISEPHVLPSHDEAHEQAQRQCTEIGINIEPAHLHRQATTESEGLQDAIRSNEMATIIGLPHDVNVTITELSTGLSTVAETGHRREPALLVGDSTVLAIDPMGAANETGKGDVGALLTKIAIVARRSFRVRGGTKNVGCDAIFCHLPTNTSVVRITSPNIPKWNHFKINQIQKVFGISREYLDEKGNLVLICRREHAWVLSSLANRNGYYLDHTTIVLCATPFSLHGGVTIDAVLGNRFIGNSKRMAVLGENDDISSGGMERSPTLHEKLLSFYTEEGNVVLQMYAGCGLLARPGLRMGRHVLLLDRQESMEELQHLCNGTGTLPSCHAKRKLIVFDVNGVLLKRWRWESAPSHAANILNVGRMGVSLRPGILRLLRVVFELFDVGLWSSMQEQNLTPIINLIKSKYKEAGYGETFFKFCLHQGHCEERHCEGKHPKFNLVFVKNFRSELVAAYIKDPLNTILVDDNPEKAIENPPHTLVTVRSYDGASNDNVLLMNLLPYLEGLHAYPGLATDYIKNTPFKQVSTAHGGKVEHTMEATFGLGGDAVMAHPKL
ncbi:hypothetical protein GOP47_0010707 [Adiantum capillus-veneris]|uniref:FCP1 homology domain-containing protein n=1 Tax=Adiantum capillus-veneris TaxID=13818 RepID=A0A9D4UVM0_ADICA|nr:hypothetical protein GOP47_0010707 [Adiantum capillus-veneris]